MRGSARRQARLRQRLLVVVSAAFMVTTGVLPSATPVAATQIQSPGVVTRDGAAARTAPVYLREVTPVEISSANDGALPLTPDPTIGRGPTAQKAVKLPKVATEIPSMRDEHSRTLLNPDGTYTLEATEGRMNYQAPDGTWQPEDLSLTPDAAGLFDLRVKASDRVVRFGSTDADAGLASITADGHVISIRAIGFGAADTRAGDDNRVAFAGSGANGQVFAVPTDTGFEFGVTVDRSDRRLVDMALHPDQAAAGLLLAAANGLAPGPVDFVAPDYSLRAQMTNLAARMDSADAATSARAKGQVAGLILALLLPLKGLRGGTMAAAADPLIDLANTSRRTGVRFASEYTSPSGSTYYDVNQSRALPQDHPLVATGHHGGCAEFGCLLQAYEAEGLPGINGGSMRTVFVRSPKSNIPDGPSTGHGAPATPCVGFCQPLLDFLGVRW